MPEFREILNEVQSTRTFKYSQFDDVRQKYIEKLSNYTKRDTIVYSSKWNGPANIVTINTSDIQKFMSVVAGLKGDALDLIIHTNGGDPNAADAIIRYLRKKFNHIRAIIPQNAMSAGTIMACGCDEIVMGKHSFLGPIDPQYVFNTPLGVRAFPAYSFIEQFEEAKKEIAKDPKHLKAYLPLLQSLAPAMPVEAKKSIKFTQEIVYEFLAKYMFGGNDNEKAKTISEHLSEHENFNAHGKKLDSDYMKGLGLNITDLESDQTFQDLALSVFHATEICFKLTAAVKIVANSKDRFRIENHVSQRPNHTVRIPQQPQQPNIRKVIQQRPKKNNN